MANASDAAFLPGALPSFTVSFPAPLCLLLTDDISRSDEAVDCERSCLVYITVSAAAKHTSLANMHHFSSVSAVIKAYDTSNNFLGYLHGVDVVGSGLYAYTTDVTSAAVFSYQPGSLVPGNIGITVRSNTSRT